MSQPPLHRMSACDAQAALAQRSLRAEDLVRACLERIAEREPQVQAWQCLAADAALARARALDAGAWQGPLHGLPIGVKDLIDTADLPSGYGSPIYAAHRPLADASCVAALRAAGGVVMGKTVTTEFATFTANQTRNPLRLTHTPGGSSSGSAAAVADAMVPLALGTQTAGSLIRPASFCGIVAFKPTFGRIWRAGVKPLSDSLDTVGTMARDVPDAALLAAALAGRDDWRVRETEQLTGRSLRVGLCRTFEWPQAGPDTVAAFERAQAALAQRSDVVLREVTLPEAWRTLVAAQTQIQLYEQAQSLRFEHRMLRDRLSARLQGILDDGARVTPAQYDAAQQQAAQCRAQLTQVFDGVDVLLAPSAIGAAPPGLDATGDPLFCRIWTLMHTPALNIPVGTAADGLPVGLQVIALPGHDALALSAAHALHQWLA